MFFQEALLEPVARLYRFFRAIPYYPKKRFSIVDIGCGPKIRLYSFLKRFHILIRTYIGIDPLLSKNVIDHLSQKKQITCIALPLKKRIQLPSKSADVVTAFAFLEHIEYPKEILSEMVRITKKGGVVILTTPTWRAKNILEFLSYTIHLISKREIAEHKQYFCKEELLNLARDLPIREIKHHYFELGLNNILVLYV